MNDQQDHQAHCRSDAGFVCCCVKTPSVSSPFVDVIQVEIDHEEANYLHKKLEQRRMSVLKYKAYAQDQRDAPPKNHRVPFRCDSCRINGVEIDPRCQRCIACCDCVALGHADED